MMDMIFFFLSKNLAQPEKVEKQPSQLKQELETRLDTKKPPLHEFYIPRTERLLEQRAEERLSQTEIARTSITQVSYINILYI